MRSTTGKGNRTRTETIGPAVAIGKVVGTDIGWSARRKRSRTRTVIVAAIAIVIVFLLLVLMMFVLLLLLRQ